MKRGKFYQENHAISGDKKDALERWLFDYAEPPYKQTYKQLAKEYRENLEYLKAHESESEWSVDDLECTPEEIRGVVEERLDWLKRQGK